MIATQTWPCVFREFNTYFVASYITDCYTLWLVWGTRQCNKSVASTSTCLHSSHFRKTTSTLFWVKCFCMMQDPCLLFYRNFYWLFLFLMKYWTHMRWEYRCLLTSAYLIWLFPFSHVLMVLPVFTFNICYTDSPEWLPLKVKEFVSFVSKLKIPSNNITVT